MKTTGTRGNRRGTQSRAGLLFVRWRAERDTHLSCDDSITTRLSQNLRGVPAPKSTEQNRFIDGSFSRCPQYCRDRSTLVRNDEAAGPQTQLTPRPLTTSGRGETAPLNTAGTRGNQPGPPVLIP